MFSCFIYILICLFSLGFSSFYVLKHVRLLVSLVFVFTLFSALKFQVRVLGACLHTHHSDVHASSKYVYTTNPHTQAYVCACILQPKTLIQVFLFLCFFYIICLCFVLFFYMFLNFCFSFYLFFVLNMIRLGFFFSFSFFFFNHEHAYDMSIH